jgi:hypothetical protein
VTVPAPRIEAARKREGDVVYRRMMALLAGGSWLVSASPAVLAQGWGSDSLPRDGACFYRDADYRGQSLCASTGEDLSSLSGGVNDRISSSRILGRAEVIVFEDGRFRGSSERFAFDVRNLQDIGWNDRISSLQVRSRRGSSGSRPSSAYGQDPDRIVRRAYQDILERDPDPAGLREYRSRIIDDGWTEQQVREALRNSPEYRQKNTMTYAKAQDIVRSAYLAVLGREPDAGSRGYVDRVFRDKWTQQDVERELRKSPEYRNRPR